MEPKTPGYEVTNMAIYLPPGPLALVGHCFSPNPRASSRKDRGASGGSVTVILLEYTIDIYYWDIVLLYVGIYYLG